MLVLLQLHLHSWLNTWLHWIGQRQLQDQTRNIKILGFGAFYIRGLTVFTFLLLSFHSLLKLGHISIYSECRYNAALTGELWDAFWEDLGKNCPRYNGTSLYDEMTWKYFPRTLLALCEGNPPLTCGLASQRASDAENFYMSWFHHDYNALCDYSGLKE